MAPETVDPGNNLFTFHSLSYAGLAGWPAGPEVSKINRKRMKHCVSKAFRLIPCLSGPTGGPEAK